MPKNCVHIIISTAFISCIIETATRPQQSLFPDLPVFIISRMMDARRDLCLILLISSYVQYARPNDLNIDYSSNTRVEVSQGTQAQFECSSSRQLSAALLRTGRIEWCRNTRYSTSTQVIARWSNDHGTEILLDDPDGRYSIEGGLSTSGRFRQYLTIRQVQRIDQTDNTGYYCALFNSTRSLLVKSLYAPLTVKYPPADHYPLCTATPDDISKDVELMCTSEKTTPGVTVQWYKDNVKVSDAHQSGYKTKSVYPARRDELDSEFECRLYYRDGDDVEFRRSCNFSEPRVAILRMGGDLRTGQNVYHAFTVSNPPLISDINCTLEASSATSQRFDVEFPGYAVVEVGPVAQVDNGSTLVCQARNVFGVGKARMVVYRRSDDQNRETTLPSVVTNYMPVGQVLQATIWPPKLEVIPGGNATFVCSYSLTTHSSFRTNVEVKWEHDDIITTEAEDNILYITNVHFKGFEEATITCVVTVSTDDHMSNSNLESRSSATIRIGRENPCDPKLAPIIGSSRGQSQSDTKKYFIGGIVALVGLVVILMIVLMFVMARRQKHQKKSRSDSEHSSSSQVTYRADPGASEERSIRTVSQSVSQGTIKRALPAQPDDPQPTTTLRSVVTTPVTNDIGKQRLESISSCNTMNATTADLPYQEMVGDTGINRCRHGSVSSNIIFQQRHAPLVRSLSIPASMIPVPNGGFLPVAAGGQPGVQRSASENAGEGDGDACYEDPDAVRERRRLHRAMSNDYQTTTNGSTNMPVMWQQKQLVSQYANTDLMEDSVFLV